MTDHQSAFWTFSLIVYGDADVQRECLNLQDTYGVNVDLLLFCAFAGAVHGAILPAEAVEEAADAVREWHKTVVTNLRAARRALKAFATERSAVASSAADLRASVKAAEIKAKRIEQTMLEHWSASRIEFWLRARPADAVPRNIKTLFATLDPQQMPDPPSSLIAAALVGGHKFR
jgi:uncharacterized protein (TIGR02444 family)